MVGREINIAANGQRRWAKSIGYFDLLPAELGHDSGRIAAGERGLRAAGVLSFRQLWTDHALSGQSCGAPVGFGGFLPLRLI
jgi:hypothetical protein